MFVLFTTNRITNGIYQLLSDFEKASPQSRPSSQDAVIFEAAAYCHAWLEHCGERPRQYQNEKFDEDSPYSMALNLSCSAVSSIITKMMLPPLPQDALHIRSLWYASTFNHGLDKAMAEFEWKLQYAVLHGVPQIGKDSVVSLSLFVSTAVKTAIRIDHQTILPALVDGVRNLHNHGDDLLEEWRQRHGHPV